MSNEMALRERFVSRPASSLSISTQELQQLSQLCHVLSQAPFYAKLGHAGVLAIWLTARELNIPPMMALNGGLYNIEGKVSMSAQLMNMMLINAGCDVDILYLSDQGCKIRFSRMMPNGKQKSFEYEFNQSDAKKAKYFGEYGLNGELIKKPKDNWILHPRAMYFSRTISGGARIFSPDIIMNCYTFGEIEDITAEQANITQQYVSTLNPIVDPAKQQEPSIEATPETIIMIENFKEKFLTGTDSEHEKYIHAISEKSKKSKEELIVCAAMNEKGFIDAFDKWRNGFKQQEETDV